MIARYSTDEMNKIFSNESRFDYMKKVEIECALVQSQMGLIPRAAALAIKKKAQFNVNEILEIEKTTKHDVIAFVSNMAQYVGEHGRFIHFGLTSSDVLDTALSLQLRDAIQVVLKSWFELDLTFSDLIEKHQETICPGRTHGIYAEITTFGFKLAGFREELRRNIQRLHIALEQISICKLSGAVGTSSALGVAFESQVAQKLKLKVEPFATQVIPRDRHAEVYCALSLAAGGFERWAVELRHLQRSEVSEVIEGFSKGQKGSSAMPHKKNPISAENISGLCRLLRSYSLASLENIALWHERDISHSSVERIIGPDAFHLAHYISKRMNDLLKGLFIDREKMKHNTKKLGGVLFSSHLLLHLVEKKGLSREEAYQIIQSASHQLKEGQTLETELLRLKETKAYFSSKEIKQIFSGEKHLESIRKRLKTYGKKRFTLRGKS